jgi:uncharacterized membrane protein HdeD (DUF308 family)
VGDMISHNNLFHDRLRAVTGRLFWLGVVLLVLGVGAVIFPMVSTLVATVFIGWILLISGIVARPVLFLSMAQARFSARFCSACCPSRRRRSS